MRLSLIAPDECQIILYSGKLLGELSMATYSLSLRVSMLRLYIVWFTTFDIEVDLCAFSFGIAIS